MVVLVATITPQQTGPGIRNSLKNLYTIKKGQSSSVTRQGLRPIYSEADYLSYWTQTMGQSANSAPRGINWSQQMLLAVHIGQRPSGGYDADVFRVDTSNNVASVLVRERKPVPNEMTTQALTSPWVLLRFDRTSMPFRMELTQAADSNVFMPNGGTVIRQGGLTISMGNPTFGDYWSEYERGNWCTNLAADPCLISTQQELYTYWYRVRGQRPQEAPTDIDWNYERLFAIHVGERAKAGARLNVVSVDIKDGQGVVYVQESFEPLARGRSSRPYLLLRVDRRVANWKIEIKK